jgi:arginine/ornithine N-succinyltransferase beta subunit
MSSRSRAIATSEERETATNSSSVQVHVGWAAPWNGLRVTTRIDASTAAATTRNQYLARFIALWSI